MSAALEELVAANARFYERFEALDLDGMAEVWDQGEDVWCVHPGTPAIRGWAAVRRSWAAIFAATSYLQFIVTDVVARVDGDAGVIGCSENVLAPSGPGGAGLGTGLVVATNVFVRRGAGWRLVAHHGSPVVRSAT